MTNNSAKGRNSYDSTSTGMIIPFLNRNVSPYATEAGSVKFEMVPVTKQKDLMINHARMFAQQEYDRIMELVAVLEKQAQQIKRRLEITDAVHGAVYQFQPVMGNIYWLAWDKRKQQTLLTHNGPNDWSSSAPEDYEYMAEVKYMGDHTWLELNEKD
jgi:ABC-type branched-subunit amino acid transport system substrate-binding protein